NFRKRVGINVVHESGKFLRFARRDTVVVHHVEWIASLPHVQPSKRTPSATNRVEGAVFAVVQHVEIFKGLFYILLGFLEGFPCDVWRRQAAERKRHATSHARAMHIDKLK